MARETADSVPVVGVRCLYTPTVEPLIHYEIHKRRSSTSVVVDVLEKSSMTALLCCGARVAGTSCGSNDFYTAP